MTPDQFSHGKLRAMKPAELTKLIGEITTLLMASKLHRRLEIRDIADLILPAIDLNQYRLYRNPDGAPIALVTWAKFSPTVEARFLAGDPILHTPDRASGTVLYFTDFIAPYGHVKQIARHLKTQVFPDNEVRALRVIEKGKARSVAWRFTGAKWAKQPPR